MTRIVLAVSVLILPLAARAQYADGRWGDGTWSGDDEYSYSEPQAGDPRDGYAEPEPPPLDYSDAGPTMDDFHEGLDGYGRWVETPEYGVVWQPASVGYSWHPYWDGRWVWTEAGWTWVSTEPWGWATYHYGRWAYLSGPGWIWLPGRVWAPAWVAWRYGDGFAGWCPLGPHGAVWDNPRYWVFVDAGNFLQPVRGHAVPMPQVTFPRVRPIPVRRGPHAGPPPRTVEKHTRIPVRAVPVVDARTRTHPQVMPSGAVPMYRPKTAPIARSQPGQRSVGVPARSGAPVAKPSSGGASQSGARAVPVGSRH
ncbi:MAG: DUF6600 domain-containing protein [Myxococcales bacterium]